MLPAVHKYNVADTVGTSRSWFGIKLDLAKQFGFVDKNNTIAANLKASYPYEEESGSSIQTSLVNQYSLKGKGYRAVLTPDIDTTVPKVEWYHVNTFVGYLYLSRAVQWTLTRLNESFEALLNTKETVMVYSDLVQSSVVGSGRYPLLREVTLERTGRGRVTMEPQHREWIPVRSKTIDIVEIELATASGPLTHLTDGKTIVTVGLQQL